MNKKNRQIFAKWLVIWTIIQFGMLVQCAVGLETNGKSHQPGKFVISIDQGKASKTLLEFGKKTRVSLVYHRKDVEAVQTNSVNGTLTPAEALSALLDNTPLKYKQDAESGAFAIISLKGNPSKLSSVQSSGNSVERTNTNPKQHKTNEMNKKKSFFGKLLGGLAGIMVATNTPQIYAQEVDSDTIAEEEVYELSPFEITTDETVGYLATSSLAGSRINTDLKDVASAISVVTREFIDDTASVDIKDILVYQTNAEVAGIGGNYYGTDANDGSYRNRMLVNPHQGTRLRGLNTADLTRNFFATSLPVDAFNTERMDIQRGPNSILFGLGSPAGIINTTLRDPVAGETMLKLKSSVNSYGSHREVIDYNVPLVGKTLTARIVGLNSEEKFRQDYTFEDDRRVYAALRWQPQIAEGIYTQVDVRYEHGEINSNRPVAVTAADYITNWFGPLNQYLMYDPQTNNGTPQDPNGVSYPELKHYFSGAPARNWWNGSPATIFQNPGSTSIGNGHVDAYRQRDGNPWGGLSGVTMQIRMKAVRVLGTKIPKSITQATRWLLTSSIVSSPKQETALVVSDQACGPLK